MGGKCGTNGGTGEVHTAFWWGESREGIHLKDLGVDGDHTKTDLQGVGWGGKDWINLTQDRDKWRALVNVIINFQFPKISGNFWTSWGTLSFSGRTLFHGVIRFMLLSDVTVTQSPAPMFLILLGNSWSEPLITVLVLANAFLSARTELAPNIHASPHDSEEAHHVQYVQLKYSNWRSSYLLHSQNLPPPILVLLYFPVRHRIWCLRFYKALMRSYANCHYYRGRKFEV
jgi:hypothetical protein